MSPMRSRIALTMAVGLSISCFPGDFAAAAGLDPSHAARIRKAAGEVRAQVAPRKERRVLIFDTPPSLMDADPHKGYCIPYGAEAFRAIGEATGAFRPVSSDDLAMLAPESLRGFDAIVLNNTSGSWITPTAADLAKEPLGKLGSGAAEVEAALRKGFVDFIEGGGGVVAIHFAIAANRHWPEFREILGATFTGHPWNEEIGVTVEEPRHPLVAAFGGKGFRIADEIYEYGPPYDRSRLRVLLSIDPASTNMGVRWIGRKDGDFALAWATTRGKGRIFNTSFGHREELYRDPRMLRFYLDAIQWAAGDLEAPAEPRAELPDRKR